MADQVTVKRDPRIGHDYNKVSIKVPAGRYAVVSVDGYEGFVLIDHTCPSKPPEIMVRQRMDSDPDFFKMTQQSPEPRMHDGPVMLGGGNG